MTSHVGLRLADPATPEPQHAARDNERGIIRAACARACTLLPPSAFPDAGSAHPDRRATALDCHPLWRKQPQPLSESLASLQHSSSARKSVSFVSFGDESDIASQRVSGISAREESPHSPSDYFTMGRSRQQRALGDEYAQSSSGDETTAIVGKERGGKREYSTQQGQMGSLPLGASSGPIEGGSRDAVPGDGREEQRNIAQKPRRRWISGGSDAGSYDEDRQQPQSAGKVKQGYDGAEDEEDSADEERRRGLSWWKRFLEKHGTLELENKGSVARDHLALERTFLAWLRTSLSFASIGLAITQLFRLNTSLTNMPTPSPPPPPPPQPHPSPNNNLHPSPPVAATSATSAAATKNPAIAAAAAPLLHLHHIGKPLGATFLATALLVLCIGFHRYFESQHYVVLGRFPASRLSVSVVAGVTLALVVVCFVLVIGVAPGVVAS